MSIQSVWLLVEACDNSERHNCPMVLKSCESVQFHDEKSLRISRTFCQHRDFLRAVPMSLCRSHTPRVMTNPVPSG